MFIAEPDDGVKETQKKYYDKYGNYLTTNCGYEGQNGNTIFSSIIYKIIASSFNGTL